MPTLENILATTNTPSFGDDGTTAPPAAPNSDGERFDQVMSRALSPKKANASSAQNRQRTNYSEAQKRDSSSSNPVIISVNAAVDSATATTDLSAPVKTKNGLKPDDAGIKPADAALPIEAATAAGGSQTTSILLLAPTLAACFLQSFAPAAVPNSAANNSAAAAVSAILPAGAEDKNGAATAATIPRVDATAKPAVAAIADAISRLETDAPPKLTAKNSNAQKTAAEKADAKTAGVSAVVPDISGLAGAGDAAPKKVEAVPADSSPPDDSGNTVVSPNPSAEPTRFAPAKPHGTSVAKQDVPMKNMEQTNKVAGPGEKVLPGDALLVARENNLPGRGSSIPVSARVMPLEMNVTTIAAVPDNPVRSTVSADGAAAVSNFSDVRSQALDRTHDLMALHASRLVDAKSDSLQVVLKPDAGTQLSLELRQRGNGIEAQAVLQQGDFAHLKQHWPELQQRLEQRGIKLAPLTSDGNFTAGSGSQGFRNQQNQPAEREPILTGAFAGFAPAGTRTILPDKPATQTASSRGWQKWA